MAVTAALFSSSDAVVAAAVVPVIIATVYNVWAAKQTRRDTKIAVAEFKPNGGSSLRDAINRLEDAVTGLHHRHDDLSGRLILIEDHITQPKA